MQDEDSKRVTLEIEGRPSVVDTIVTLLRYIEACGRFGTTRYVEMMVDGDGGAQIALRIDGEKRPLDADEEAFLLEGTGEGTEALRRQYVTTEERPDGVLLKIDLA
ncbi:hypothetical protein [Polyangium jinanense]|uniref:Uncharacterized protein n=1 Tax=Polyangium jinanense TaxID=2829994 RepID=A0A9X3XHJ1_9BACT|nr:hypothetical protein [Polyangium jinanense]MDC3959033.1 hypothetical protein [Polyangium jinanense]MDC3989203.1 hypothetical protein [Polyangium jinanense]